MAEQYFESFRILFPDKEQRKEILKSSNGIYNALIELDRGKYIKPKLMMAIMIGGLVYKMFECVGETKDSLIEQVRNSNSKLLLKI